jgi:TRAP-type C4-dicarboxylate transport system substrate-binding protein
MSVLRLMLGLMVLTGWSAHADGRVLIKLGTLAPEGSVWHDALLEVRQKWLAITAGEVELRIYAAGVLGGEDEMVRKLQRRSLDAVAISSGGLPHLDDSVDVLNIPLLFETYEELDFVRDRIAPELEKRLEARGFKVLNWTDAGWVYFFTKSPVRTPDDLRRLRLWTSSGAPEAEELFKRFGLRVVPLPMTDMLTGLQTGLIEAIDVPPLFALLDGSYRLAGYMTDLRWAPVNGAVVISSRTWQEIPARHHEALLESIRAISGVALAKIRESGEQSIAEMRARGLNVIALEPDTLALWRREAEAAYPVLRASTGHPELFDEVLRLSADYKKAQRGGN